MEQFVGDICMPGIGQNRQQQGSSKNAGTDMRIGGTDQTNQFLRYRAAKVIRRQSERERAHEICLSMRADGAVCVAIFRPPGVSCLFGQFEISAGRFALPENSCDA